MSQQYDAIWMESRHHPEKPAKTLRSGQSCVAKMEAEEPNVSLDMLVKPHLTKGSPPSGLAQITGSGSPVAAGRSR